jgi:hypothetical protein
MAHLLDPKLPDMTSPPERVIERIWNEPQKRWAERGAKVVIANAFFEKGAMRAAFKMKFVDDAIRGDRFYVAKLALRTQDRRQEQVMARFLCGLHPETYVLPQYEKDCKMQMIAVEYAKEYNKLSPPKPVEFLEAFMLQVMQPLHILWIISR